MAELYWRWPDSENHEERHAHYAGVGDARAQADHDFAACQAADDYSTSPTRIKDARGKQVWTAPIPEGR